jgi:hypothetical protein
MSLIVVFTERFFSLSQVRHPGHLSGGDDSQGGSAALVPAQDCPLQECQRPELPPQLAGRSGILCSHPPSQARPTRLLQAIQGQRLHRL